MFIRLSDQVILDIPILSTCYKILLDKQPDFDDLVEWQPEIAKSFKYILEYEEETPLEDVLARTFTIDLEIFGEKVTENPLWGSARGQYGQLVRLIYAKKFFLSKIA